MYKQPNRTKKEIFEESKKAANFIFKASQVIIDSLMDPQEWQNYPELHYVTMIKEMF